MTALAGAYVYHPIFGFRCYPWLRGTIMGVLASLPLAIGVPLYGPPMMTVVNLLFTGAVYGLIIDVIATKVGGEGEAILK